MVDPTAWAGAQLPSTENKGVTSILDAYSKGQQQNLYSQAIRKGEKAEADQAEIDRQGKIIVDFWKAGDRTAMMNQISELAKTSPEAAKSMKDTLFDLDKTNAFMGTMHLYNAAASDDPAAIETSLRKSKESYGVGIENPINTGIDAILNMEMGSEKQNEALMNSLAVANKWEMLTGGESGLEYAKLQRQINKDYQDAYNQAIDNDRLEREQEQRKKEFAWKSNQLSSESAKLYNDISKQKYKLGTDIERFDTLAKQFDEVKATGGAPTWVGETIKKFFGAENEKSATYTAWSNIKASEVVQNLPSGPASDKDIKVFSKGFPSDTADPQYLASWLRGASKMKQLQKIYYDTKLKYIENKRNPEGFDSFWDLDGGRIITDSGFVPELDPEDQAKLDLQNQLKKELPIVERRMRELGLTGLKAERNNQTGKWEVQKQDGTWIPLELPGM